MDNKVKKIKFVSFVIIQLFFIKNVYSQKVVPEVMYFDNYALKCEGDSIKLGLNEEFSCFHRKIGVCGSYFPDEVTDKSSEINVSGANHSKIYKYRTYQAGTNNAKINVMMVSVKLTETCEIKISSRSFIELVIGNTCPDNPPESYIWERIWVYRIKVIPKPPTPSLTVERYISPNSVNFIASGCPTNQRQYNYEYQWNNTLCLSNITNNYSQNNREDGIYYGAGGTYYRVRCTALSGTCKSDPSGFEKGAAYNPPEVSEIPDDYKDIIQEIESIKKSARKDYHHYEVETIICQQNATNQSVCNINKVFELMLENKSYIAPVASDIPGNSYESDEFFDNDMNSVQQYGVTKLPGAGVDNILDKDWGLFSPYVKKIMTNPIITYIDRPNNLIINYTSPEHLLRPGRIIRQIKQECDTIKVITIGEGLSFLGDNILGEKVAQKNTSAGQEIFKKVDKRFFEAFERRYK